MESILTNYRWNTSPTAEITVKYEYKRVGADMQYRIYWNVYLVYDSSYYYNGLRLDFTFDKSVTERVTVKPYAVEVEPWNISGTTNWITVSSKISGSTELGIMLIDTSANKQKMSKTSTLIVTPALSALGDISNFDIDSPICVPVTRYTSSVTETLSIYIGNSLITELSNLVASTSTYVVLGDASKATIYDLMRNTNSCEFTFYLTSYYSGASIGVVSKKAIGTISNALPEIDVSQVGIYDADASVVNVTKNNKIIVQNKSNVCILLPSATGRKGASIVKYTMTIGADTVESNASGVIPFGRVTTNGNLSLNITVTDSRGNTTTATKGIKVFEYTAPVALVTINRKNNYENETHLKVEAVYPSVDGVNNITISYKHAKVGEQYPSSAQNISNNTEYVLDLDNSSAYNFYISVLDAFGAEFTKEAVLTKGEFPLFIDTSRNAIGINAFPQGTEALRVGDGEAIFEDNIVLRSPSNKYFLVSVNDSGQLSITQYN